MMNSLRSLLLFCVVSLCLWTVFASFTADDFIASFQQQSATLSLAQKKTYYLQVYNNVSLLAVKHRSDSEQFNLYTSLKTYIRAQIKSLWSVASSPVVSLSSWATVSVSSWTTVASGMNIPHVDMTKVRAAWLSLHNTERATKWLTPFTYSTALEWTATTWAKHLADIGKATHVRKSGDGYYSYTNIKAWFINQWITFATQEKNGQSLFTENLTYWYYTCKKTDCTDDFIKAIKGTWKSGRSFFMSEKWRSYKPHYNAIMGNYSTVGLGVVVVGSKYYLVSHYTQDLK